MFVEESESGALLSRAIVVAVVVEEEKTPPPLVSPLTLRNIPSIASAYEWSRNQIEGSRSSSSKGTVGVSECGRREGRGNEVRRH